MKLEFVTKNEFYKTVVKKIVTITSTEKNEFEGSVLECVIKFANIVNPCLRRCPTLQCSAKVQVRGGGRDVDG